MSIKPLSPEAIETFSLVLHPKRNYTSSSLGHTGSVKIFSNPSAREKDNFVVSSFVDTKAKEETLDAALSDIRTSIFGGNTNVKSAVQSYMDKVRLVPTSAKNTVDIEVLRYTPTTTHTANTEKKKFVQDKLMPFYRSHRPNNNWAYPNYHSVNFFTASSVTPDAVWLYPNKPTTNKPSGCYSPTGSFTFEVILNPKYTNDAPTNNFKAGTLLHLSSSFALSVISGSSKDANGKVNAYRLMLQLSSSADVTPSTVTPGQGSGVYAFLSDDNSLLANKWQHVLVTWGTKNSDAGTGSFYIDGEKKGTFIFNANSILPPSNVTQPSILCVGNFYEGTNSGANSQIRFFAADTALREGLYTLDATSGINYPTKFSFNHKLNAEFHDLSIREDFVIPSKAIELGSISPKRAPAKLDNYLFYLPPLFIPSSPYLTVVNGDGGVLNSPYDSRDGSHNHPFSAPMSFGVAGRYNNLENFTYDFASNNHARLLNLTFSVIQTTAPDAYTANEILYSNVNVATRNLMILPCDDGNFRPNFELVNSFESSEDPRFVDDLGTQDVALVSLKNMVSGTIYSTLFSGSNTSVAQTPLDLPANLLTIYQRTQDSSSNEVVFFDFTNLFYGERIRPGSFLITDSNLSGSNQKVKISLKDDSYGGLYRSDTDSSKATWNHVGNIFYEEGIAVIKSPALPFYGKNGFDIEFEGEKSTHVTKLNVIMDATSYNTSSNPSWNSNMSSSFDVNREQENQKYVIVTGVNFHNEDLNVVMRAQLAQPIIKQVGERFLIKLRYDW